MKLAVICFTRNGYKQLNTLYEASLGREDFPEILPFFKCTALKNNCCPDISYVESSTSEWAGDQMRKGYALLFIGATGIAVRSIAPHVQSKLSDSPVLVMDDSGKFVIPLLSGHVGGANELANFLSDFFEAIPVITTATDIHEKFAIDLFAKEHNLSILNKENIARVSAKVLEHRKIRIGILDSQVHLTPETACKLKETYGNLIELEDFCIPGKNTSSEQPVYGGEFSEGVCNTAVKKYPKDILDTFDVIIIPYHYLTRLPDPVKTSSRAFPLLLISREYIIGMGCKKGKNEAELTDFADRILSECGIEWNQVYAIASADRKKEEPGLICLAERKRLPFLTFSSEELNEVTGEFHESEFVRTQLGVGNVCERAAALACGEKGEIIRPKIAQNGMTLAIARRTWQI